MGNCEPCSAVSRDGGARLHIRWCLGRLLRTRRHPSPLNCKPLRNATSGKVDRSPPRVHSRRVLGRVKGGSSPCSLRCAWLRSRFAPLTRPALPAKLTTGRLQGMVLSVSPRNGRSITTGVLWQRQRATTLGSIWLRQCPSVSGAFLGEATRPAIRAVAPYGEGLPKHGPIRASDREALHSGQVQRVF